MLLVVSWILECTAALFAIDFVSGLVHWAEDTFGTESTPIFGPWLVAPNVLHHIDGAAFVTKSWLESSWDLALVGVIILVVALFAGQLGPGLVLFVLAGANANEIHKWNHSPSRAPFVARLLWRTGLLQKPSHHSRHHAHEKNTAYCVVTPFVNPVLDRFGFWRALERVVVPWFGAPRREDLRRIKLHPWVAKRA